MMNPLKLFLLTLGTASLLAVAPSIVERLVPRPALAHEPQPSSVGVAASSVDSFPSPASPNTSLGTREIEPAPSLEVSPEKLVTAEPAELPKPANRTPVPSPTPIPYRAEVARAQELLGKLGIDAGKVDGKQGQRTANAVREFQKKVGLTVNGDVDAATLERLQVEVAAVFKPTPEPTATPAPLTVSIPASDPLPAPLETPAAEMDEDDIVVASLSSKPPIVVEPALEPTPEPQPSPSPTPAPTPTPDPQFVVVGDDGQIQTTEAGAEKSADSDQAVADNAPPVEPLPELDPKRVPTLRNMNDVRKIQHALRAVGTYPEAPDGKWGQKTIVAMREFQQREELGVTGKPNRETWERLVQVAQDEDRKRRETVTVAASASKEAPASAEPKAEIPGRLLAQPASESENTAASPTAVNAADKAEAISERSTQDSSPAESVDAPAEKVTVEDADPAKARSAGPIQIVVPESKVITAAVDPPDSPSAPLPLSTPATLEVSQPAEPQAADSVPAAAESATIGAEETTPNQETVPETTATAEEQETPAAETPDPFAPGEKLPTPAPVTVPVPEISASNDDPLPAPAAISKIAAESVETTAAESSLVASVAESEAAPAAEEVKAAPAATPAPAAVPAVKVAIPPSKSAQRESERMKELEKRIAEAGSAVEAAGSDTRLEIAKYAPKDLEQAKKLLDEAKSGLQTNDGKADPEKVEGAMEGANKALESAKASALKAKATEKVKEVEQAYTTLKDRFAEEIRSDSKLADTMTKVDTGFTAMQADFEKGNFEPILQLCDGFKLAIENLSNLAAKQYLENQLEKNSVKSKLRRDDSRKIAALQKEEKYLEAADELDALIGTSNNSGKRSKEDEKG